MPRIAVIVMSFCALAHAGMSFDLSQDFSQNKTHFGDTTGLFVQITLLSRNG